MATRDPWLFETETQYRYEPGQDLGSVMRDLEKRVRKLEEEIDVDSALRQKYPPLQDAYEQYQAVKKLVKNNETDV